MSLHCFLCHPSAPLVYLRKGPFFAMFALGPIAEGHTLIATEHHGASILDLDAGAAENLMQFINAVRAVLRPLYGEVVVTEHGRVPLCEITRGKGHEEHCFHAHMHLLPIQFDPLVGFSNIGARVSAYASLRQAHSSTRFKGEYLYFERTDGSCLVAEAPRRLPRQFFRSLAAVAVGHPEYASWRRFPRLDVVEAAVLRVKGRLTK